MIHLCQLTLRRAILRRAASQYSARGWAVIPGAPLIGGRFDCGRPGCPTISCHPAVAEWAALAGQGPDAGHPWWRRRHHAVLLATGRNVDALELPAALGRKAAARFAGPIAMSPPDRWTFLIRPRARLHPDLARRADVVLHGAGSWIALPPTEFPGGRVRWLRSPQQCGWTLPSGEALQRVLMGSRSPDVAKSLPTAA